ncbi:MAG: T9SS type A sorting domain-containing protein, partial [Bacteroidota bacterium]|nr:T9SS type A sorting domain-containing protein [Bacteroidota bacterium]
TRTIQVGPPDAGVYTYSVTITDSLGCSATGTKTIVVKDVRCGQKLNKVLVCWPGRYGNTESCLSEAQATLAVLFGAKPGSCSNASARTMDESIMINAPGISVYPNPSNGNFVLRLNKLTNAVIKTYDQNGRLIATQSVNSGGDVRQLVINLGRIPTGLYLVQVIASEGTFSSKILIQR